MNKILKSAILVLSLFMLNLKVSAIDSNSPVYSDISYNQCVNFQESGISTTGSGYFGHCIKANCYSGVWETNYYISPNIVRCSNGNQSKYTQVIRTGCSNYSGSCEPASREKYCTIITYYDCNKTNSGIPFTTTTKAPPLTVPTQPVTTRPSIPTTTRRPSQTTTRPSINTTKTTTTTTPNLKSGNNSIESLKINNAEFVFNKNITNYTVRLEEEITSLEIDLKLEDTKATFIIENNEVIDRTLPIKITVTAEDETVKVYVIDIKDVVAQLDNNSKIKNIDIEGFSIKFDPEVFSYYITITNQKTVKINVEPESEFATYFISGNTDLKNKSKILITAKAEDDSETVYIVNVKKSSNFGSVAIVILIVGVAIFVAFKIFKKLMTKEKVTSYEYE